MQEATVTPLTTATELELALNTTRGYSICNEPILLETFPSESTIEDLLKSKSTDLLDLQRERRRPVPSSEGVSEGTDSRRVDIRLAEARTCI